MHDAKNQKAPPFVNTSTIPKGTELFGIMQNYQRISSQDNGRI